MRYEINFDKAYLKNLPLRRACPAHTPSKGGIEAR